jgi:hypothetical protein
MFKNILEEKMSPRTLFSAIISAVSLPIEFMPAMLIKANTKIAIRTKIDDKPAIFARILIPAFSRFFINNLLG